MSNEQDREALSALVDGELPPARAARLLDVMRDDPQLREQWRRHHLIRAVLSEHGELAGEAVDIADRVRDALDREPVALAPRAVRARSWPVARRLALAASVAVVGVVIVLGLQEEGPMPPPVPVANVAPGATAGEGASTAPGVTLASGAVTPDKPDHGSRAAPAARTRLTWNDARPGVEARLNGYLLNHNEYLAGGVRGMLPYARIVGYESRN